MLLANVFYHSQINLKILDFYKAEKFNDHHKNLYKILKI